MAGLLRDMRDRKVEKITFGRGLETTDIRALMDELGRSHGAHRGRRSASRLAASAASWCRKWRRKERDQESAWSPPNRCTRRP
jgi:hypothetical protein